MNQNNLITFQRGHTHSEKVQQRGKELRLSAEGQSPGPLVPPSKFLVCTFLWVLLGFSGATVRAGGV